MAAVELLLVLGLGVLGLAVALRRRGRVPGVGFAGASVLLGATLFAAVAARKPVKSTGTPGRTSPSPAVGSQACRSCHPGEHDSWRRSFHRTMTRVATPDVVTAPFDGRSVEVDGRSVTMFRKGDELWARLPDPDVVAHETVAKRPAPGATASLVDLRVVMATGSHHQEVFWVGGKRGNELRLAPVAFLLDERRFVSRRDAFLQPPDAPQHAVRWNSNCVACHATLGRPEHDEMSDRFETTAAELGIACEACHGAGGEHVRRHRNPFERIAAYAARDPDPTIVNPARLDPERASEVCGQCHSYTVPKDEREFWVSGYAERYRPGDVLEKSRARLRLSSIDAFSSPRTGGEAPSGRLVEATADSLFWPDGTIRVGGRELNAMEASACFVKGSGNRKVTCLSCHSMHDSAPDDQLRRGSVDAPCAQCHEGIAENVSAHTHHPPESAGSSCVNCHMPYTTYALFKGIRSHRIDSPSLERTLFEGRPNACNLCHADRTLVWVSEQLQAFYGKIPGGVAPNTGRSAVLEDLLTGNAAERAIAAWALGRPESQRAAGNDWQAALLSELLDDPYAAVRKVALGSLRTLPGFAGFEADFVAPPEARRDARMRALELWKLRWNPRTAPALLLDAVTGRDETALHALVATRDDRPVTISE
jgi:predicted CXXCH cytochrome family protein